MLKIAYSPNYKLALPNGHLFPLLKFDLIYNQLKFADIAKEENFFSPNQATDAIIEQTHTAQYWHDLKHLTLSEKDILKIGFPMSLQFVELYTTIVDGTIQCALFAQKYGVSFNIAGGMHNAFSDHGEAFCALNDMAIAANYLINNKLCSNILIIDLDVHQGNGTAQIFRESPNGWHNKADKKGGVFTFSMHGEKNYPKQKEESNLDIELPDGTDDMTYLTILKKQLDILFETVKPDFVFFNAGIDVLKEDIIGRLDMTVEGCQLRDKMVFEFCQKYNAPVVVVLGGGHADRISTIVDAHVNTFRMAKEVFFNKV
jgi:acetoin utilization deacetylase AcuC-like enzyme